MKVIFLDVDGVLVHRASVMAARVPGTYGCDRKRASIDPSCVQRLVRIVQATGARVVVSSTWRKSGRDMAALSDVLSQAGIHVYDVTPRGAEGGSRGTEIQAWLNGIEVSAYVCLDDDLDVLLHPSVIVENGFDAGGLQDHHVEQALDLLGGA